MRLRACKNKLIAADITLDGETKPSLITPYKFQGNEVYFYWETGPSRCTLYEEDVVPLKLYGSKFRDTNGGYNWDKIDIDFIKTYYSIYPGDIQEHYDKHKRVSGWISPTGEFYEAPSMNHDGAARRIRITLDYFPVYGGFDSREDLFKRGWIIYGYNHMLLTGGNEGVTGAQRRTLETIANIEGLPNPERIIGYRLN